MEYSMRLDGSRFGNIEVAVGFINDLLNKYDWEDSERSTIEAGLSFIAKKMNDEYLYLSVIGEFSSGKSTFINALLRENLLKSANAGGTTAAKTVIRYAPERDVIVQFKNGEREVFSKDFFGTKDKDVYQPEFRQYVVNLTTSPEIVGRIQEVTIEHPAEILKNGMAIIDTPGTNFVKEGHEKITVEAIRDLSDVSIIFVDSKQQWQKTLMDFVKKNLSDILSHCIFIAARLDDVDECEREETLSYIKRKISSELELRNLVVLPYLSRLVLGEADEDYGRKHPHDGSDSDRQKLIAESYKTEELIFQRLKEQRVNIIAQKLSNVLKDTLQYLHSSIDKRREKYQKKHEILLKHQKMVFEDFIKKRKSEYLDKLIEKENGIWESIDKRLAVLFNSQWQALEDQFFKLLDPDAVKAFLKTKYPTIMKANAKKMADISHECLRQLQSSTKQMADAFWVDFSKEYSELEKLDSSTAKIDFNIDIKQIGIQGIDYSADPSQGAFWDFMDNLIDYITFDYSFLEKKWNEKLAPAILGDYKRLFATIENNYGKHRNQIKDNLEIEINKCYNHYRQLLTSMNRRDKEEERKLENSKAEADYDIKEIQKWQRLLGVANAPSPVTTIPPAHYCLYCYSVLADNANACPTCGRAVLSMQNGVADVNDKRGTNTMHQILGSLAWWKARR